MNELTIIFPDDWHCHLRDGHYLSRTVPDVAARFKRAIVMPNLVRPILSVMEAKNYRERILQHLPKTNQFNPLMTLYLTDNISVQTIQEAKESGVIFACKLYPAGVTTHSDSGVRKIRNIYSLLEAMQMQNLPLLIHGESSDPEIDIFDREAHFIEHTLIPLMKDFPELRMVLEHISTKEAVEFIKDGPDTLAATITPHHLLLNRNDLLMGGIRPHYYCLPIVKTAKDQQALIHAAISGHPKFFLGTDSAPHAKQKKESCCGAAGIYSAASAIEIYAQIFEQYQAIPQLESFASLNGARFYQLPINTDYLTLYKKTWPIPEKLPFGEEELVPLLAGKELSWAIN